MEHHVQYSRERVENREQIWYAKDIWSLYSNALNGIGIATRVKQITDCNGVDKDLRKFRSKYGRMRCQKVLHELWCSHWKSCDKSGRKRPVLDGDIIMNIERSRSERACPFTVIWGKPYQWRSDTLHPHETISRKPRWPSGLGWFLRLQWCYVYHKSLASPEFRQYPL